MMREKVQIMRSRQEIFCQKRTEIAGRTDDEDIHAAITLWSSLETDIDL